MFFMVESLLNPAVMFQSDNTVIWSTKFIPYRVLNQIVSNNDEFFSTVDLTIKNFMMCLG